MTNRTDEELMGAAARGDTAAFDEFVGRYRESLVLYFARRIHDRGLAREMTQEVLLKLWSARRRYAPLGKTSAYLFTIARNHLFNWLDARSRRPGSESLDGAGTRVFSRLPRVASSEEAALQAWMLAELRRAVDELPPELGEVVKLGRFEGLKYREIAERLGVPVGTVKSRMHYAVNRLRDRLDGIVTPREVREESE
jgi:RNA polymerase sigma-70 factor (ECF subfamily)